MHGGVSAWHLYGQSLGVGRPVEHVLEYRVPLLEWAARDADVLFGPSHMLPCTHPGRSVVALRSLDMRLAPALHALGLIAAPASGRRSQRKLHARLTPPAESRRHGHATPVSRRPVRR